MLEIELVMRLRQRALEHAVRGEQVVAVPLADLNALLGELVAQLGAPRREPELAAHAFALELGARASTASPSRPGTAPPPTTPAPSPACP